MDHRFLVSAIPDLGTSLDLDEVESKHARVVRLREGERIELFDGAGNAAAARVLRTGMPVVVEIESSIDTREPSRRITLALALIQPEKFELAVQKATELGVWRIQPLVSELTEVRPERILGKLDRWQRIATEAAKQCGRARIPEVLEPRELATLLREGPGVIGFDADGEELDPAGVADDATLLIGPEGGWSESERNAMRESGTRVCSLGLRRLRAETAAMIAVALAAESWRGR